MNLRQIKAKIKQIIINPRVILGGISGIVLVFVFTRIAQASVFDLILGNISLQDFIFETLSWIGQLIASFAAQIIILEAKLLSLIVEVSVFTKMPVVVTGWKVARDFANLFFIALLVYVAFCYILRIGAKNSKGLLVKIIIMAILINFSLMIGGIIIDFSQVFFKYFIFGSISASAEGGGKQFSDALANALQLNKLFAGPTSGAQWWETGVAPRTVEEMKSWLATQMQSENQKNLFFALMQILFVVIFSFLIIIVLGALMGTLFIRLFWLWILLILAPLAWIIGVVRIPVLSDYAKQWWQKFLKWCFIAPIIGFFLFLALSIAANMKSLSPANFSISEGGLFGGVGNTLFSIMTVMQMLIVIGFVVGGLIAGQNLGDAASQFGLGIAKKAGLAAKNRATLWGLRAARPVAKGTISTLSKAPAPLRMAAALTGVGVLGRTIISRAEQRDQEEIQKRMKNYNNLTPKELEKMVGSIVSPREKTAAIASLVEKTGGDIDIKFRDDAMKLLPKFHMHKAYDQVKKAHPEWNEKILKAANTQPMDKLTEVVSEEFKGKNPADIKIPDLLSESSPYYNQMNKVREGILRWKTQVSDPKEVGISLINADKRNVSRLVKDISLTVKDIYKDNEEAQLKLMRTISNYPIGAKVIEGEAEIKTLFAQLQKKEEEKKAAAAVAAESLKKEIKEKEEKKFTLYDERGNPIK